MFVKDLLAENKIEIKYVNTRSNLADFLTKPLLKQTFLNIIKSYLNSDSFTFYRWGRCWTM